MLKEINKLLRKAKAEEEKNNYKECVELYNIVGGLYSEIGSYEESIHYHKKALDASKIAGSRLGAAEALRYIGESKAALSQFEPAIESIKKYLNLVQKLNNDLEIQRAWTTLGRVYLMQAQEMKDNSPKPDANIKRIAQEAEDKFKTALILADTVRDQIDTKEFAQMRSGLLVNIGLVDDICGRHNQCVIRFNRAIEICKAGKIKEDLFRCQFVLAGIYRQRNDIKMAAEMSEDALTTAKQVGKKIHICEAYIEKGLVQILQKNFKEAKRTFVQAYVENSPNEEDHLRAIRLVKTAHLISETFGDLSREDTSSVTRMKLCDRLGDLFTSISYYRFAVEFYTRALTEARISCRPNNELAKFCFSIAETYADAGKFENAISYYEKELNYRFENDGEQCQSLIKIAYMHQLLEHDEETIVGIYEKALEKAGEDQKLVYNVLSEYVPFLRKSSKMEDDEPFVDLKHRKYDESLVNLRALYEESSSELENNENNIDPDDEIEDINEVITDDEDNDEVLMLGKRRARGTKKFKANEVGDTPLHEACIKGDLKRVKALITREKHEVNPRDNAGWIPLHEACNHGHYEIVEFLLEHGADVNNRGLKGTTPLHDAATNGHINIMRLLMKHKANVIAMTDAGETVLSCFRDYKSRNYSEMSNQEMAEYKNLEQELLTKMDRCGFNLINESLESKSSKFKASCAEVPKPKPKHKPNPLADESISDPVKEYRSVIGTLKRKRPNDLQEAPPKWSLPATYDASSNPSVSTKQWIIDDVSD